MPRKSISEGEKRDKRISLVVRKSTYDAVKLASGSLGLSINEFCTQVLESVLNKNSELVEEFEYSRAKALSKIVGVNANAIAEISD